MLLNKNGVRELCKARLDLFIKCGLTLKLHFQAVEETNVLKGEQIAQEIKAKTYDQGFYSARLSFRK